MSPTVTGVWKVIASSATVTTLPFARWNAVTTGVIGLSSGSQVGIDRTDSQCVARWYW